MNFLLGITANDYGTENLLKQFSLGDVISFGGQMLLIGMATVFAVLCIIWLCLTLFKIVFHDLPERKKANKTVAETENAVESETNVSGSDDEIVAVIAAAIAMAESESSGAKFNVVSFRRK